MNNNELFKLLINILLHAFIALLAGFIAFLPIFLMAWLSRSDVIAVTACIIATIVFTTVFLYPKILSRLFARFQDKT